MASVICLATNYPNARAPLDCLVFAQDTRRAIRGVMPAGWALEAGCAEVSVACRDAAADNVGATPTIENVNTPRFLQFRDPTDALAARMSFAPTLPDTVD